MDTLIHIRPDRADGRSIEEKEHHLLAGLQEFPSLIVALSGGADSAYLAWAAHRVLGDRALSVTALSASFSAYDGTMVRAFAISAGIRHELLQTRELENPAYRANTVDRCYYCKDELFTVLNGVARQRGFAAIAYGINADDTSDFRPGHRAAKEHAVIAPLLAANLRKSEIRELSRRAGLCTWDRPASACLSSRIPYGTEVTPGRLALIERGEAALRDLGFRQFRVRLHETLARVEIERSELPRALEPVLAAEMSRRLKAAGFAYVTLDLQGYRQGSLNEAIRKSQSP
jgi:pyridinium-3,5-biscarboxylic acid mononucleotide sulfurtransferase